MWWVDDRELRQDLYLLRFVPVQEASTPNLKLLKFTKFHWFGTIQVVRVQDYDCVHTVFTLPLGNCIFDFDLGYLLGIRGQGGGFEVDNGHTGKEENFCKVYGYELESLRALLLSPRAHSKGLGAIDVLVSFPIIGEFYVGGLPIQQQGCNLRVENSMFSNSSFRPQVTSGMQKMAAVGECTAEGNWI
ncbi:plastid transcriptionally active7 [Prunus dulcis]|uniref:Plastid transcriptionally active7 n=1 Tax=Prunus dulcis TaxID=3755 RepID=A0A4Y1QNH8_PRUDU|nr:plastid transcriptionally active7 [Prunus dulcis]